MMLDTNILVYANDPRDRAKQERAMQVYEELTRSGRAVVSVQCLTELFNVLTRSANPRMSLNTAARLVEGIAASCQVLDLTPSIVTRACWATERFQLSIWDSLIWAAAERHAVPIILTEDLQHNQLIAGVRIVDPFHPEFRLSTLSGSN